MNKVKQSEIVFHVFDIKGNYKGEYTTLAKAANRMDKLDNLYGSYGATRKMYHKESNRYVSYSEISA